jgi:hypothetical protein
LPQALEHAQDFIKNLLQQPPIHSATLDTASSPPVLPLQPVNLDTLYTMEIIEAHPCAEVCMHPNHKQGATSVYPLETLPSAPSDSLAEDKQLLPNAAQEDLAEYLSNQIELEGVDDSVQVSDMARASASPEALKSHSTPSQTVSQDPQTMTKSKSAVQRKKEAAKA